MERARVVPVNKQRPISATGCCHSCQRQLVNTVLDNLARRLYTWVI